MAQPGPNSSIPDDAPSSSDDAFTVGDAMLERAKKVGQKIEERVRELTDDTKTSSTPLADPTDELPPVV